jgi:hypothetical protein
VCRTLSLRSRWSYLVVALFVVACKRTQHLAEGPPLPRPNYDASVPMGVADPAAMARAMAAADAGARAVPGVPSVPPGVVPVAPPVVDAGAPIVPQMVVIDAGAAPIEPPDAPRRRRRRR